MNKRVKTILGITGLTTLGFLIYVAVQRNRKDPPIYFKKKLSGNYNARTIPPFGIFILESERRNLDLIEHEKVHWKQFQELGLIGFYSKYAKQMKEYGYDGMPMEKEARFNESEFCREHYTECVRSGLSRTIFNPNFRR